MIIGLKNLHILVTENLQEPTSLEGSL